MKKILIFAASLCLAACDAPNYGDPQPAPSSVPTQSEPDCAPELECNEP